MYSKALTLVTAMLFSITFLAQLSKYEGLYVMYEPTMAIVMIAPHGTSTVKGFITDGATAEAFSATESNGALVILTKENGVTSKTFVSVFDDGHIELFDEMGNTLIFTRTEESAQAAYQEIENALAVMNTENSKTTTAPATQNTPGNSSLYADKKFLHLYTGNGYTEKWAYYLYGNGRFYYRSGSSYMSGGYYDFSAATSGEDGGTYKIVKQGSKEYLYLAWNDGNNTQLLITKTNDGYLLDDVKYYLVGHNEYE